MRGSCAVVVVAVLAASLSPQPSLAAGRSKPPCATSLASCPERGCAEAGTPDAALNEAKRSSPKGKQPIQLTFDQLVEMQSIVDDRGIPQGGSPGLSKWQRKKLKGIKLNNGSKVGEGRFAEIVGFIEADRNLKAAGAESVNCRLPNAENNDIHIPIVENKSDTEYESMVVEPIPQTRDASWTATNLKKLQSDRKLLLIRGQLFYDNQHKVRDDPDNEEGLKSQPKRFTLWEIHPVTEILVCKKASNNCDPAVTSDWAQVGNQP